MRAGVLLTIFLGFGCLAACRGQVATTPEAGPTPSSAVQKLQPVSDDWSEYRPGGDTKCSDGSEFYLLTRTGDANKLVFFLEGGGGCSASATCDPEGEPTYKMTLADQSLPEHGIFDFSNTDNPFADYSVIYVPYCTGDVHIGSNDAVYDRDDGTQFTVHHSGRANVQAGLDYAKETFPTVDTLFVTGASAGAIPTPLYASYLAEQYPDASIAAIGDGAGGYRYASPEPSQLTRWGIFNHINDIPGFETLEPRDWSFEQLYIQAGQANPEIMLGRFDFAEDAAQSWFLGQNSQNDTLLANIRANNRDITAELPRFRAFIAGGREHVVFVRPGFYDLRSNGVALRDWVADFADFQEVDNVECRECAVAEGLNGSGE